MRTIRSLLALVIILSATSLTTAQSIYVKAGGGYNLGFPAMMIDDNYTSSTYYSGLSPYYLYSYEGIYGTFAKGMSAEAALGLNILEKTFGLELSVGYLMGSSLSSFSKYLGTGNTDNYDYTYESKMISFMPSFVVSSEFQSNKIYARAGAVIAIPTFKQTTKEVYITSSPSPSTNSYERVYDYSGSLALGINGGLGMVVGFGAFGFFIEGSYTSLTWAPSKRLFSKYTQNGVDQLTTYTTSQKEVEYVDSYNYDSRVTQDPNKPRTSLKSYFPYSALGVKAGIVIGL
jgi:hypothetical protein